MGTVEISVLDGPKPIVFFFEEMSLCRGPWIDMEDTRSLPVDARPCAKQQWQEELSLLNSL